MSERTVKVPDGWRPVFRQGTFPGVITLERVQQITDGGAERWTEGEAHLALAKLLEERARIDATIENVRSVIAEYDGAANQVAGSLFSLVDDLRSALDASFSCVDEKNAKILASKVDAALERADGFLGRPKV